MNEALALARAQGLAGLILVPGPNLFHLTGLTFHLSERPIFAFFPVEGEPAFLLPTLEADKVGGRWRTFTYDDRSGPMKALRQAIAVTGSTGRWGVEGLRMRFAEAEQLQRAGSLRLEAADELLVKLRMRKGSQALRAMRRAVAVAEAAFQRWIATLHTGMTEREAAARLIAEMLTGGADALAFDPIIAAGPNGALPHALPGDRPFREGDWVIVDWGVIVDGYASDITRVLVFGQPEGPLQAIHRLVLEANRSARAAIHPGATAGEIDRAARSVIEAAGYGGSFVHRTGHGLGLEIHEPPYIAAGATTMLEPGMTFTIEPGIYLPGIGGIRIEDDLLVTEGGAETLTTLSREPWILA